MMRLTFLLLFFALVVQFTFGQEKTIFGAVVSGNDGKPIKGVIVILLEVKMKRKTRELVFVESRVRTRTNEKGEYMLPISLLQENKIRFRKEGYTTVEIDVGKRTRIDLSMTLNKQL